MRIDPAGIYASNGQPARIIPGKIDSGEIEAVDSRYKEIRQRPREFRVSAFGC
jgi:hypothetical protein